MTLEQNITAILESYFSGFKDELIEACAQRIMRQIERQSDTPQTEETCERCVYVRGSQWCQGCNGTPKRWDGEKIVDTPQTESTGSPIGDYRDGVGAWQTERSE